MNDAAARLSAALSDRYRIERELGAGGMARELVTAVTARLTSLKRPRPGFRGHFSDLSRVAASAADTGAHPDA